MIQPRLPHFRASALALALLLLPAILPAQQQVPQKAPDQKLSPADAAILKAVDTHYNHLRSLRTNFTETYAGLGLHKSESGTLLLSKPGRMRWSYTDPAGKLFVLDGKFAWSYAPGDAQAQRVPARQLDDLRSPLRLLLGHAELARELIAIHITPQPEGSALIEGIPRGQQARVKLLTLLTTRTGAIEHLKLEEIDGSTTEFRFTAPEENSAVTPADFAFIPPAGVPVVDGLPPI